MLNVPNVTMNGGRFNRVTKMPFRKPAAVPKAMPISSAKIPGTPFSAASLAITNMDKIEIAPTARSMPAVNTIKRLTDGQRRDHRRLLQNEGDRARLGESRIDDGEHDAGHHQHHQRTEGRMRMQQMLHPLQR